MRPTDFPCWIEGKVDRFKEHAEVWWGDGKEPVALVGAPKAGSYVVEFLPVAEGPRGAAALAVVRMNLTYELGQCTPTNPWGHIRECCKETREKFGGLACWAWSEGCRAKTPAPEPKALTYNYRDLIRAFADWLQYRDAGDSAERRYYENRWRAHSQAFGISFSLDESEAVRVKTKVQIPEAYLNLIERATRSYGHFHYQSNDCFSGISEAPEAFCRLYERYALRIRKADRNRLKAEEKLRTVLMATCCDAVKILYGRQKKPVTDADLKACGIDAVPCPASLQSDWN